MQCYFFTVFTINVNFVAFVLQICNGLVVNSRQSERCLTSDSVCVKHFLCDWIVLVVDQYIASSTLDQTGVLLCH